jgi:hypothetical protein
MYYAITLRHGRWEYVCSGSQPQELYHQARELLQGHAGYLDEEGELSSPESERLLDHLRIVPEVTAREQYRVGAPVARETG